jgi:hypothetical protein
MIPVCSHSYVFGTCPVLGCPYCPGMNYAYPGQNYPPMNAYPYPYPYPNSCPMAVGPMPVNPYPAGTAPMVQAEVIPADQVMPGASFVQGRVVQDTVIQGTVISDTVVHGTVVQEEGIIQGKAVSTALEPPPKPPRRRPSTDNTTPTQPPPPITTQQQNTSLFPTAGLMYGGYPATQTTCVHGFPVGMCFFWDCNRAAYEQFQMNSFSSYCNNNLFTSSGLKSANPTERQSALKQLTSAWDSVPDEGKDQVKEYLQDQLVDVSGDVVMEILGLFTS